MDGKTYEAGIFAHSLRKMLFSEHIGLDSDISDPVSNKFFQLVDNIARSNTRIYDEVFSCIPSDEIASFSKLSERKQKKIKSPVDPVQARQQLKKIKVC